MKKIFVSFMLIFVLFFVLFFGTTAYALAPPYSFGTWGSGGYTIVELLEQYIEQFLAGGNQFAGRPFGHGNTRRNYNEYKVVFRTILFPVRHGSLVTGSAFFQEERWGNGIDMGSFDLGRSLHVSTRYGFSNPLDVYRNIAINRESIVSVHEGVFNGIPLYGYTFVRQNGDIYSTYNMVIGDVLVRVSQPRPFCEDDIMEMGETGLYLPVYVRVTPKPVSPWAADLVEEAIKAGLVPQSLLVVNTSGTPVRRCLTLPITRAEFSSLAVRLYEIFNGEITGRVRFADTRDVNVQKLAYVGVVFGVGDGRFNPDGMLTREHAAVILSRLSDADGVAEFVDFTPEQPFTREQGIVAILRLYNNINDQESE
ncbi:MAG: S-layer homology domain-containing protein [Defluviitaleaceae bacterium]|nr:S-layer homology domain-containing protein [Defluviitaleaceae bacterium]